MASTTIPIEGHFVALQLFGFQHSFRTLVILRFQKFNVKFFRIQCNILLPFLSAFHDTECYFSLGSMSAIAALKVIV